jgi:murein DD-endopeptidase MepM/ murein hydrolase activator NlpD
LDGNDDVVSFTDSPQDRRFQLVQKDQRKTETSRFVSRPKGQPDATHRPEPENAGSRSLPIQGRITSPTGMRTDPFDGKLKHHNGLDIAAPAGTPVKPVAPGTVIFSGWKKGYGNTVILDHLDGMVTVYAHHASNNVSVGETVDPSTVIALSGSTGRSTGPHLHFEAWRGGSNITPEFMPGASSEQQSGTVASAPINRYLQPDGTIVFTNMR